ncbi:hypothetical protein GCM10010348_78890 [Streptomyces anthocyanicus]|uniref:hypothetical protein n=1 Tax=Streptomyces anthocyanicus TaxID=68174 RepID=UPI001873A502|nr:hypothetical protein [Streptomyces anthocyanicus]GHC39767.1 hypothetical protein GCM10010348_78890 [Streptomyces anthocyanicus]
MATQKLIPAPTCADTVGTAPLNPAAAEALRRLELALTTPDAATVEKVRVALGYPAGWKPNRHLGETATYLTVWSQMELNDLFEQVGGTVTTRQVERSTSDGSSSWTATEIALTLKVPDVGPVEIVTDIEDDPECGYRTDIPVVAVARYRDAEARANELIVSARTGSMSDLDADDLAHNVDLMAGYRTVLAKAGRLDLIGGAS